MEWYIILSIALIIIIPLSIFTFIRANKNMKVKKLAEELTDLRHKELFILEEIQRLSKNKDDNEAKINELNKERNEIIEKEKKLQAEIAKSYDQSTKKFEDL